ncbi:bifunctional adenosylcobinamide kinase/adenosylcobinamide-phosphate guanylyltransferase [Mycolicibacterium sp. 018/SC-01/001]|uniref:bifunctional adenosylcobinamide kinase/adenosylcobinamide-phosphate guanylyltransferase n=1 Tax=Mycolicibacterium sp. 018/SC-01/001 TaxID=2592069 RepID=UPI00117DD01E|nr:bifunctional adenosylcobinamide kinase/adenosylcobinamide-phosphate guanylyltransferase [Mycolicibacterium sp. 018/SC-01/001]TRW87984.1 bifunctional adenosylcobinamide kinase/adenosylcobinamide-phosphate guanylyltransferase [Mycolicibacterium sp. 018/SC-01/001]
MRILVTGGVRSGKSRHAEELLAGVDAVTYIAPGRPADGRDADWDARVAAHRARRPVRWSTVETTDVTGALADAHGPVLLDCLSTWVVAVVDEAQLWEADSTYVHDIVAGRTDALCETLARSPAAVVVTNEVGLGVVPAHRSGVLFRDLLGTVNQRVAAVCDEVHLVIAGRVLRL